MRLVPALVPMFLLSACEDGGPSAADRQSSVPASAAPSTVETPPATARASASVGPRSAPPIRPETSAALAASASASAVPATPPGLLGSFATATEVKVSRVEGTENVVIDDREKIQALLEAIDVAQKPTDECPRGLPAFTLSFKDGFGKRLGSLGIYAEADGSLKPEAALRDALGDECHTIELEEAAASEAWLKRALPLQASDG